jgi:Bacterial Ig-like domain (group 4).
MRKRGVISILAVALLLNISGCGSNEKTTVLSDDVKQEAMIQEEEIKKCIDAGINFLNEEKYDDAKSSFERALSMDKSNKGAYIEIKNKYIEKQRLDDAYYIIKLAISNDVDTEEMRQMLNDIKSKFEVTKLSVNVYQNNKYTLPSKIKVRINNEEEDVDVVWNGNNVDTSKLGSVMYEGKIDQYDRSVELELNIIKLEKVKMIGGISYLFEKNGKRYLDFDDVEFFYDKDRNDRTAENEAKKDGYGPDFFNEDGRIPDNYYIRNNDRSVKTYEISSKSEISVCGWRVGNNTISQQKSNYEQLKSYTDYKGNKYDGILCYIYLENNVVVKVEEQYRP